MIHFELTNLFGIRLYHLYCPRRPDNFVLYQVLSTIRKSPNACVTKSGTMGDGLGPVTSSSVVIPITNVVRQRSRQVLADMTRAYR